MSVTRGIATVTTVLVAASLLGGCATVMSTIESFDTEPSADSATPSDGLKEALRVGTARAVEVLGQTDGYLANELVRISVPSKLEPIEKALRIVGAGDLVDEFVTSMNRAAEAAAPLAKRVFLDAIREMTFEDAMSILRGDQHEATDYLRARAGPELARLFRPIVSEKLDSVGATRSFNELAGRVDSLPFVTRPTFDLVDYVTDEALDGLFRTIAREEERIRDDPVARTTELLRKFFGQS